MNKEYKLDESQIKKQLQTFNTFITLHTIIKVSSFLKEYNLFLTEVIGCGAFGIVFKAYDDYNSREVAIKIMINQNSEKKKELEEEIKILRKIKSEYVIKIYEHFYDEDSSCFIIITQYYQYDNHHSYLNNKKGLKKKKQQDYLQAFQLDYKIFTLKISFILTQNLRIFFQHKIINLKYVIWVYLKFFPIINPLHLIKEEHLFIHQKSSSMVR